MGLLKLAGDVRTYLATNAPGLGASVVVGRRAVARQDNQGAGRANRIAFVIGDPAGKAGSFVGRQGSTVSTGNPRQLTTLRALAVVHVWAVNAATPELANSEEAQLEAAWSLLDWTLTAIHESVESPYLLGDPEWVVEAPIERPFGQAVRFKLQVDVPVLHQRAAAVRLGVQPVVTNSMGSEPSCSMGDT